MVNSYPCFDLKYSIIVVLIYCCPLFSEAQDNMGESARSIEVLKIKTEFFDTIELQKDSLGIGTFHKVIFKTNKRTVFEIKNVDGYDSIETSTLTEPKNLVSSRLILVKKLEGRYFVSLFGFQYGCCPRNLTILKVDKNRFTKIFDDEFDLMKIYTLFDGNIGYLGRKSFSQGLAAIDSLRISLATYSPALIYRVSDKIQLDSALSKKWNEENYVFRGYVYDHEIIVANPSRKFPNTKMKTYVFKEKNQPFPK